MKLKTQFINCAALVSHQTISLISIHVFLTSVHNTRGRRYDVRDAGNKQGRYYAATCTCTKKELELCAAEKCKCLQNSV